MPSQVTRRPAAAAAAAASSSSSSDASTATKNPVSKRRDRGCARSLLKSFAISTVLVLGLAALVIWKSDVRVQDIVRQLRGLPTSKVPFAIPHRYTKEELSAFDGSDTNKPILISILGQIYDVSASPEYYGKEGGYNWFAGRDASLSFIDGCFNAGCFDESKTVDTFTPEQIKMIAEWADFYVKEDKYIFVGTLEGITLPDTTTTE